MLSDMPCIREKGGLMVSLNLHAKRQYPFNLITVLGATASGKTRLAVALARRFGGEIISADSRQVFRGMDIGTGKDLHEYGEISYHLIDILEPGDECNVFSFQRLFMQAFADITARNNMPLLCGGTGLYLDAVLRGYQMVEVPENTALRAELADKSMAELTDLLWKLAPQQHNRTDLTDRNRTIRAIEIATAAAQAGRTAAPFPAIRSVVIGIHWEREALRRRITERLRQRLAAGMLAEVQQLHAAGVSWEQLDYYGLEYRFVAAYLRGELTFNDMFQKLNSAIHGFAKRQGTWFRRMEKQGVAIHWIAGAGNPVAEAIELLQGMLEEVQC
mgnify:CR=1 FL=1